MLQLFSCAYTEDLRYAVQYLRRMYNFESEAFIGLGYSMGSNVLVKYLGEEQGRAGLTAGISVGNPFDLETCSANFGGSLFNRLTYDRAMNGNLKALFFEKVQCMPVALSLSVQRPPSPGVSLCRACASVCLQQSNAHEMFQNYPGLDLDAVKQSKSVRAFDHELTRVTFKYASVDDYYADASSIKKLPNVRVPLLCVSARDDPISIVVPDKEQVEANPNVILCVTKRGGHLGFFESRVHPKERQEARAVASAHGSSETTESKRRLKMWSVKVVTEFAESILALERERKHALSRL